MTDRKPMPWIEVCAGIAQGAINISEGHTTIEAGSPVHKAMIDFCEHETVKLEELLRDAMNGYIHPDSRLYTRVREVLS
jgi:hypothetical protein